MSEVVYNVTVSPTPPTYVVEVSPGETQYVVVPGQTVNTVATTFVAGPPGPVGPAGSGLVTSFEAAIALSGHRVMITSGDGTCNYASSDNVSHALKIVGISTGAAAQGAAINLQNSGRMTEPTWNWIPEQPVFCGTTGNLTQTPPTTGFQCVVAVAESATSIIVRISEPIKLA
jgi:hypothetical protein